MPRDVDLTRRRPPLDPALVARATGKDPSRLQAPQPAQPLTGGQGAMPLPQGQLVRGTRSADSLTKRELATLEELGWDRGMPIPENMAEIVERTRREMAEEVANLPPPVDPSKPPIQIPAPVDFAKASPEVQARFRAAVMDANRSAQTQARDQERARVAQLGAGALEAFDAGVSYSAILASSASQGIFPEPQIVMEPPVPTSEPVAAKPEPPAAEPEPVDSGNKPSETGADAPMADCPHCGKPLDVPSVPEPEHTAKMAFLQSVMGQKCFMHEMSLFGDNVHVVFRTLTVRELEVIYKQAYRDKQTGHIDEVDYWERLNRYRLFLQLVSLRSQGAGGFHHVLPDGLNEETNPTASAYWKCEDLEPGETALPRIEEKMLSEILPTEILYRTVIAACNQFNRLVAKMEAMVDNDPFWRRTEPPS